MDPIEVLDYMERLHKMRTAAVFIQRLFTAHLPPICGWATLAWMRRREYV